MTHDPAFPDPERITTQVDFGREIKALRERTGLTIREVARLTGIPVSTAGDYFSGRHLPADRQQLTRLLGACGVTDQARVARWDAALQRARQARGRRAETGTDGLRARRRITEGALAWEDTGRESAALWRGSQLAAASEWASDGDNRASLPTLAAEFIDASIAEETARQRAEQLRTQWLYGSIVLAAALVVVAAGLTIYVLRQRRARAAALNVRQ